MAQKVIQIGSSAGITLSPEVLETIGLKVGDIVHVSGNRHEVLVRPAEKAKPTIEPEILSWTNTFIDKNRALLERLSDK
jgi:putative addiction module antidote